MFYLTNYNLLNEKLNYKEVVKVKRCIAVADIVA